MSNNTPSSHFIEIVSKIIKGSNNPVRVAEIGVDNGATTREVAKLLRSSDVYDLFDREDCTLFRNLQQLLHSSSCKINIHSNTRKLLDSYAWSLAKVFAALAHDWRTNRYQKAALITADDSLRSALAARMFDIAFYSDTLNELGRHMQSRVEPHDVIIIDSLDKQDGYQRYAFKLATDWLSESGLVLFAADRKPHGFDKARIIPLSSVLCAFDPRPLYSWFPA
jgi:hypothetical protein